MRFGVGLRGQDFVVRKVTCMFRGWTISSAVILMIGLAFGALTHAPTVAEEVAEADTTIQTKPDIWIFGILGSPHLGRQINAGGVRAIIDLNLLTVDNSRRLMKSYASQDLGLCLTLRWKDPANKRQEGLPAPEVVNEKIDILMDLLKTDEAKQIGDRLWIQFFNEATGGPGTIQPNRVEGLFEFATRTAERIRKEAPHVKICGPALTGVDVMEKDEATLPRMGKQRRQGLLRCIRWSIEHADAVDLHLHAESGPWARRHLKLVREAIDREPGGQKLDLVVWEWSCARFPNRTDKAAIRETLIDVYSAMCDYDVKVAAYGAYYPPMDLGEQYQWKNLMDTRGQKNEPFYSFFVDLANGKIEPRRQGRDR